MRPLLERCLTSEGGDLVFLDDRDPRRERERFARPALRREVEDAARVLHAEGVEEGDRVVLALPTGIDFIRYFLGAIWMGALPIAIAMPLRVRGREFGVDRLLSVDAASAAKAVIAPEPVRKIVEAHGLKTKVILPETKAAGRLPPRADERDDDIAFVQYTAGSTGKPKGVVITFGNLRANLDAIGQAVRVQKDDRVLSWLPMFHDMGLVGTMFFPLFHGLTVFLYSPMAFSLRPAGWLEAISTHRATLSPGPHFAFAICARKVDPARLEGLDLSCWRYALDGAEPIQANNVKAFIDRFKPYGFRESAYLPVYGMAEATLAVTFPGGDGVHFDQVSRAALAEREAKQTAEGKEALELISVGRPVKDTFVVIRDPKTRELLPERTVGEIVVRGPAVSPRYFGDAGPPRTDHATGDLGYLANGELFVVDRIKDIIIHAGANLYPADLEAAAATVPGVRKGRVAAFGVKGGGTEKVVIAAEVKKRLGRKRIERDIRLAVREHCGVEAPSVVLLKKHKLPLTTSGKLMRSRAKEAFLQGSL